MWLIRVGCKPWTSSSSAPSLVEVGRQGQKLQGTRIWRCSPRCLGFYLHRAQVETPCPQGHGSRGQAFRALLLVLLSISILHQIERAAWGAEPRDRRRKATSIDGYAVSPGAPGKACSDSGTGWVGYMLRPACEMGPPETREGRATISENSFQEAGGLWSRGDGFGKAWRPFGCQALEFYRDLVSGGKR